MDQLFRSALARRLVQQIEATRSGHFGLGEDPTQGADIGALPGLGIPARTAVLPLQLAGLGREAVDYLGKTLTGALAVPAAYGMDRIEHGPSNDPGAAFLQGAGANTPNPLLLLALAGKMGLPSPYGPSDLANTKRAFEGSDGNIIGKFRQANEGLAQESPIATGIVNQITNPTSYLTGGGTPEAQAAARAARAAGGLGLDLSLVNELLYPEQKVLGAVTSKVGGRIGRALSESELVQMLRDRYTPKGAVGPQEYATYAEKMGLPTPDTIAQVPSDLAPEGTILIRKMLAQAIANNPRTKMIAGRIGTGEPTQLLPPEDAGAVLAKWLEGTPPTPDAPTLDIGRDYQAQLAADILGGPSEPLASKVPGVQPVSDLVRAAEKSARPNALEGLLGAARNVAERDVPLPTRPESLQLPLTEGQGAEPVSLIRDLLAGGDNGRGMVYPPRDPAFYNRRTGVDPALVPDILKQLQDQGVLAEDDQGQLINRLLTGGERGPVVPEVPTPAAPITPDVPTTGPLTSDELDQLVNFAYPHPSAQANAILAYPNPADLTEAALNRIGQTPDTLAVFAQQHPELAQRIVDLPDPRLATPEQLGELGANDNLGITPQAAAQQAGNWLTKPLMNGVPGGNRIGIAGSGALSGAAVGGLMPADSEEARRQNVMTGSLVGAGLGLGLSADAARPALSRLTSTGGKLVQEANIEQRAAMTRPSMGLGALSKLPAYWGVQTTENMRNLLQSPASSALWLKNAGVRLSEFAKNYGSMVDLYNLGVKNPYDAQPQTTTAILDAIGQTGHIVQGGKSFQSINGDVIEKLSAVDSALLQGGLTLANPAYGGIPGAGLALGLGIGYARPWLHSIYQTLDDFAEQAARHAAFQDEVTPLLKVAGGDFLRRHSLTGALPADGMFSPADVELLAGKAVADEWDATTKKVIALGEQRSKDILGNFADRGLVETAAGKAIPFIGWAVRAYPRTAQMMIDHPGISLVLTMLMFNAAAKDKRDAVPGYQVGNVTIGQDTPVLGGIAKALTGGQPGDMRVNLASGLSPIGGSLLAEPDMPEGANAYQQGKAALGIAGFSPSPVIQAIAYGLNKDFQKPGPLSRTAGLETILPGPDVPSIGMGPLNKLREAAGGSAQTATPHDRKLAEVYFRLTGHDISDPGNMQDPARRALLLDTLNPDSAIRQQADREMAISGGSKAILSLSSPLAVTPRSDLTADTQRERQRQQDLPPAKYTPQQIAAMENSRGINAAIEAYLMRKANLGTQGEVTPLEGITRGASGGERGADILDYYRNTSLFGGGNSYSQYLLQSLLGIQPTH